MKIKLITIIFGLQFFYTQAFSLQLLIPMDDAQQNHLKAYGIAFWTLQNGVEVKWLLNYRGGSFLISEHPEVQNECVIRGVSFETIADAQANAILDEISQPEVNMDAVKLEKAPKVAVYSPKSKKPWDDAVTMVLTYAEIPYDIIYDEEILAGDLSKYDWLHLHHEDFTGQYGKFWASYQYSDWYQQEVNESEAMANKLGFSKVSQLKLFVARAIKDFVFSGGFLFAMCSATDTYDIALAAEGIDICESMFDGDGTTPDYQNKLDYSKSLAFKDFVLSHNPYEYEHSDIDVSLTRRVQKDEDVFTLFEFSAKWDPVPTMLCQNHTMLIDAFMGQTTAFNKKCLKSNVLVLGENKSFNEARYIHGELGKGTWTFFSGHDPADYQHLVGDKPTELSLHPKSPGYRLILNNILFPAAKKKKLKT